MTQVILVDRKDKVLGTKERSVAHRLPGLLHRAISVVVSNADGDILIQQRSPKKQLWPLYWSNSCCSHPLPGEDTIRAGERRLKEEMGFTCPLKTVFKLYYQANYNQAGSEHELTHVLTGNYDGPIKLTTAEAADFSWIKPEKLLSDMKSSPKKYTPWSIKIMARLNEYWKITDNQEELFDLVNSQDRVIGQATRGECHSDSQLRHRGVLVLVFNSQNRLWLQKRSITKDLYPGNWALSATGHVTSGQSYQEAAQKELEEELGVKVKQADLHFVQKVSYQTKKESEFDAIFLTRHNGPFRLNQDEITTGLWSDWESIGRQIQKKRLIVTPCTSLVFIQNPGNILGEIRKWLQ
jgi:isopentenyl-diphosphate delta-isomerase